MNLLYIYFAGAFVAVCILTPIVYKAFKKRPDPTHEVIIPSIFVLLVAGALWPLLIPLALSDWVHTTNQKSRERKKTSQTTATKVLDVNEDDYSGWE